jgi:hypothetical protein
VYLQRCASCRVCAKGMTGLWVCICGEEMSRDSARGERARTFVRFHRPWPRSWRCRVALLALSPFALCFFFSPPPPPSPSHPLILTIRTPCSPHPQAPPSPTPPGRPRWPGTQTSSTCIRESGVVERGEVRVFFFVRSSSLFLEGFWGDFSESFRVFSELGCGAVRCEDEVRRGVEKGCVPRVRSEAKAGGKRSEAAVCVSNGGPSVVHDMGREDVYDA